MALEAAKLMVTVGADTSAAEKGVQSFSGKLQSAAKSMAVTGGALSLGVTAPLLGIVKSGLDSAIGFEQNMNVMQQVTSATTSQMAEMQAMALQLGADTVFSAEEAAQGMLELGKAGMDTGQIMDSIGGVMDLAAAGGVSLAEAANLTASTLNAFGLEATESSRIANIMAATANASAADISDLGAGMQQAGFAFSMANQPVENLAASLAILTNVGLTGSDAGTALKNAFMRMMNPTKEANELMRDLGISFYDTNGNMKMLPDIIDNLNTAMAGLTDEQRDAALATIFLSDGMKAFIPLMEMGKDGFNATVTDVTAAGAATETAAARMGGLGGAIEQLQGSIDSFLIGAAQPFMGSLAGIVRGAADAVGWLGQLPQPVINAGLAFAGVIAIAGPLMAAIGGIVLAFTAIPTAAILVITAVATLAAAWAADLGGIQAITATAMGAVQKWFVSTSAVVQDFARYLIGVASDGNLFNAWLLSMPMSLLPFAESLGRAIIQIREFGMNLTTFGKYLGQVAIDGQSLNIWLLLLPENMQQAAMAAGKALVAFQGFASGVQEAAAGIATAFANTKFPSLEALWSQFKAGEFQQVANTIRDTAYELMVNLDTELNITATANQLKQRLVEVVNSLSTAITTIDFGSAAANFNDLRTSIQSSLADAIGGIDFSGATAGFGKLKTALQKGMASMFEGVDFGSATSSLSQKFSTVAASVGTGLSSLANAAKGFDIGNAVTKVSEGLGKLRDNILTGLTTAINGIDFGAAGNTFSGLIDKLKQNVQDMDFSGIDWATVLQNRLMGPLGTAINAIKWVMGSEQFAGLETAVKGAIAGISWGDIGSSLGGLASAINTQIDTVFADMVTDITSAINETDFEAASQKVAAGIDSLSTAIDQADWSTLGSNMVTGIKNMFSGDTSLADNFGAAVRNALSNIQWGDIGASLSGLMKSINNAMTEFGAGVSKAFNFQQPAWLKTLTELPTKRPTWLEDLTTWDSNPQWLEELKSWNPQPPGWLSTLIAWEPSQPGWVLTLQQWAANSIATISEFSWETWITDTLDWPVAIEEFSWDTWLDALLWPDAAKSFDWNTWLDPLLWPLGVIQGFSWWTWITQSVTWPSAIGTFSWWTWISKLTWPSAIFSFSWKDFISAITVPIPGIGGQSTDTGSVAPSNSATPKLAPLTRSRAMGGELEAAGAGGININIYATIANDMDIHSMAYKLGRQIQAQMR